MGCQTVGDLYLCRSCRAALRSGRSMVAGAELCTLGAYEGVLQDCLTAVKQRGHKALGHELAQLVAQRIAEKQKGAAQVMGIRPSRSGHRFRGYSLPLMMESELLVARPDWMALPESLRSHFPEGQSNSKGMNLEQRLERQHGLSLNLPESAQGRGALWILDDVVTTGATMSLTVSVARQLGYDPIFCYAVAVADEVSE